ncbi:podoplanin isoform X2 [Loxodonta africana]|uniref:podoplanin isoform X2 n=1 Tax=Loxodonta africana TaxID=9785 RepID=UPI0005406586|nr:podoplanin isoform X2 [Loxodonta africana]XP_049733930.1 podoplanin isoform X2 [Elephas maximus indicus]
MLKVPVLLLILGSASLWVLAEGASTARPEDDIITQGTEGGMVIPGVEDNMVTVGASEKPPESTDLATLVPKSTDSTTHRHPEDLPTHESTGHHDHEKSQSTAAPDVATGHSMEKMGGETQTTVEKDGLATATLIGIIIGVLVAIGLIGGIIFVVVRKMSGRP